MNTFILKNTQLLQFSFDQVAMTVGGIHNYLLSLPYHISFALSKHFS